MLKILILSMVICVQLFANTVSHNNEKALIFDDQAKIYADAVEDGHIKVVVEEVRFPNGCQKKKLEQAFGVMEEVLNSQEFKEKVIAYVARSSGQREYTGSNGLSNEQVYLQLMSGSELTMQDTVGEANLYVKKYNSWWSKVIAWTNPRSDKWIHVNWRFYKRFDVDEMVSNLVHEWAHLMGYFHVSKNDSDSVPYAVGRIAGEVARNILGKLESKDEKTYNLVTASYNH